KTREQACGTSYHHASSSRVYVTTPTPTNQRDGRNMLPQLQHPRQKLCSYITSKIGRQKHIPRVSLLHLQLSAPISLPLFSANRYQIGYSPCPSLRTITLLVARV